MISTRQLRSGAILIQTSQSSKKGLHNIRLQSGETKSELEMPEAASLIYPDLDQIATQDSQDSQDEGVVKKFKGAGNWVEDYMDRRAAVFYVSQAL